MLLKPKTEFTRHVLTLMTGTSIAQAIPIAISPILTRLYSPEDFGVFALYMSIVSFIAVLATGRYELAIVLPKKNENAAHILVFSLLINTCISLITLVCIYSMHTQIVDLLDNKEISAWLYFIPLSVLLTGTYQSFNYWQIRRKYYKNLAFNKVAYSSSSSASNLAMGYNTFGSLGLILSSLIGRLFASFLLGHFIYKLDKHFFIKIEKMKIWALLRRYKKLPMYNLPNALIDAIRLTGINVLIVNFFSIYVLGQFSLAWKMVQMPISLIGGSLSQVFYQKISRSDKAELYIELKQFILKAFLLSAPAFVIIYIFAIDIFVIAFGKDWKLAGEIASAISPWMFFNFLSGPISNVFIVLDKQEVVLGISVLYMLFPLSLLVLFQETPFIEVIKIISLGMSIILAGIITLALVYTNLERRPKYV